MLELLEWPEIQCVASDKVASDNNTVIITSNIPARGAGRLLRPVMHCKAEGDDDGKNHRYAENEVFR